MIFYIRRLVQVSLLTVLLLFGTLLIMTSFESPSWSDHAYENHSTYAKHVHVVNNSEVIYGWIYEYGSPR